MVTVTYNNQTGTLDFYLNETLVNQFTEVQAPLYSYTMYIGDLLSGEYSFITLLNGMVSNVQIYDCVLRNSTVQLLYQAGFYGAPVNNANAVSYTLLNL